MIGLTPAFFKSNEQCVVLYPSWLRRLLVGSGGIGLVQVSGSPISAHQPIELLFIGNR
jgi:hypothetical protein